MKNKNIALGLVFGAGMGLCIGILIHSIAIGLSLGTGAGLVLGATLETGVKKEDEKHKT